MLLPTSSQAYSRGTTRGNRRLECVTNPPDVSYSCAWLFDRTRIVLQQARGVKRLTRTYEDKQGKR